MIKFEGIIPTTGQISLLKFSNENNVTVEIPIDKGIARTISLYLNRITTGPVMPVEHGNEETSD